MGLDMYIYKMRKMTDEEIGWLSVPNVTFDAIEKAGYMCVTAIDEEQFDLIRRPFEMGQIHKMTAIVERTNESLIKKDHRIPVRASRVGLVITGDQTTFTYAWYAARVNERKSKAVTLSRKELDDKYTHHNPEEVYVAKTYLVDYWRKYYNLQDFIYETLDERVHNCGYYPLTDVMIDSIYDFIEEDDLYFGEKHGKPVYDPEEEILLYHEWY